MKYSRTQQAGSGANRRLSFYMAETEYQKKYE